MTIKFSSSNSKLNELAVHLKLPKNRVVAFDLPPGWTCPNADICKTFANRETGKMTHSGRITCYAAKIEAAFPAPRRLHWANFDHLKDLDRFAIRYELVNAMPNASICRIHSSGDFFSQEYFEGWKLTAEYLNNVTFFGYTKILDYVLAEKPYNFKLQYSYGGKDDQRRDELEVMGCKVPTAYIAESFDQYPGVKVVCGDHAHSHEDFFAILADETFVLNIH